MNDAAKAKHLRERRRRELRRRAWKRKDNALTDSGVLEAECMHSCCRSDETLRAEIEMDDEELLERSRQRTPPT